MRIDDGLIPVEQIERIIYLIRCQKVLLDRDIAAQAPDPPRKQIGFRAKGRKTKEEYKNGRDYYKFHGSGLAVLPPASIDRPNPEFLKQKHNAKAQSRQDAKALSRSCLCDLAALRLRVMSSLLVQSEICRSLMGGKGSCISAGGFATAVVLQSPGNMGSVSAAFSTETLELMQGDHAARTLPTLQPASALGLALTTLEAGRSTPDSIWAGRILMNSGFADGTIG